MIRSAAARSQQSEHQSKHPLERQSRCQHLKKSAAKKIAERGRSTDPHSIPTMERTQPHQTTPLLQPCFDKFSSLGIKRCEVDVPSLAQEAVARPFKVRAKINLHHLVCVDVNKEQFKLIFDVSLAWNDPYLRGAKSDVFLMNGGILSGIVRRETRDTGDAYVDTYFIRKTCKSETDTIRALDDDRHSQDHDEGSADYELECPGHLVHHIETRDVETLSWSPSGKFTVGSVTSKEEAQNESKPILFNGMTGEVRTFTKYIAEFKAVFDMADFPFDEHILKFDLTATVPQTEMVFTDSDRSQCRIEDGPGGAWVVDTSKQVFSVRVLPRGGLNQPTEGYSQYLTQFCIKRRAGFYIHNYFFVLFLMTLMSFGAFAVPITDVAGRGSITVTMFLTVVSLKLLMAHELPQKPYMTLMERYVVSAFMLICVPMLGQVSFLLLFCKGSDISKIFEPGNETSWKRDPSYRLVADGYDCDDWVVDADRQLMLLLAAEWMLLHSAYIMMWFCGFRPSRMRPTSVRWFVFPLLPTVMVGCVVFWIIAGTGWYPQKLFMHWTWLLLVGASFLTLYCLCSSRRKPCGLTKHSGAQQALCSSKGDEAIM